MEASGDSKWLENESVSGDEQYEPDDEERMVVNPVSVRQRIDTALEILGDFSNRADKSVSRSDTLAELAKDLSEYYGYIPDLSELLLDIFSPAECVEYMDASDRPRPLVIRANTLKVTRKDLMESLSKRGVNLEGVEWSKVAIKVTESSVPIGATPEYLAGHYMLQAAASLNPVMALAPEPGERVLDMSAAPGGKTSYISQLMKNSGTVVANDLKPQRQKATVANLHRMGVKNAIVCCYDGRKIPKIMKGFDRVLLDAPCSGLGVISRDQSVKLQRTVKDVKRLAHLQKELLLAAVDATDPTSKTGGVIVYSTCSISNEENEQVVQYILQKRHVRLVETGLEVGRPGFTRYKERRFHPSLALTRRFYPHVHNMDGFYVAKMVKYANGPKGAADSDSENEEEDSSDELEVEEVEEESSEEEEEEAAPPPPPTKSSSKKASKAQTAAPTPAQKKTHVPKEPSPAPDVAEAVEKKTKKTAAATSDKKSKKAPETAAVAIEAPKKIPAKAEPSESSSSKGKKRKSSATPAEDSIVESNSVADLEPEVTKKSKKSKKKKSEDSEETPSTAEVEAAAMDQLEEILASSSELMSGGSAMKKKRKSLRAMRAEAMAKRG